MYLGSLQRGLGFSDLCFFRRELAIRSLQFLRRTFLNKQDFQKKPKDIAPLLSPQCPPIPFLLSVCLSSIEGHGPPSPLGGHYAQHESVRAIWGRILASFSVVARLPRCAYMQHRNRPSTAPGRCLAKTTAKIVFSEFL